MSSSSPIDASLTATRERLREFYASNIPAAAAMQAELHAMDENELVLAAPLSLSHNDHQNAFGGSLYNLAVLAGWTTLFLECSKHIERPHIVTRDAQMRYRHPVNDTIIKASCRQPNARQWDGFFAHYEKTGQTTLSLSTTIKSGDEIAARLEAVYVLLSE